MPNSPKKPGGEKTVEPWAQFAEALLSVAAMAENTAQLTADNTKLIDKWLNAELESESTDHQHIILPSKRVRTPRYKRVLRRGESIQSIAIRTPVDPMVREAGAKFHRDFEARFKHELSTDLGKLPERKRSAWGGIEGKELKDLVILKLESIDGASAALRAVTAALIDRAGLDQTTRYLLTMPHVLASLFLGVTVALHETIAVMEAILRDIADLLKIEGRKGFYDRLVEEHAKKRGWNPTVQDNITTLLVERFKEKG